MSEPSEPAYLRSTGPLIVGIITLIVLLGGFGAWASLTHISGAIVASGRVEVEKNRQVVQHIDGGVVSEILVTEGESVSAGDILLRLDDQNLIPELSIVENQLHQIQARRARLEAERDNKVSILFPQELLDFAAHNSDVAAQIQGEKRLFAARIDTFARTTQRLEKQIVQTEAQIEGILAQEIALKRQIELTSREMVDQKSLLERGLTQSTRVIALEREDARLLGQLGDLAAQRAQTESVITQTELEILRLEASRREEATSELRDVGLRELELIERRNALAAQVSRLDVRAPVSGTVLDIQVTTPQSVLRPADLVAYIIPQDRPLIIAARIEPINIDEVFVGQPVKLVFAAFSARTTPEINGKILLLSADSLTDQNTGEQFYRVEISVSPEEIARLGQPVLPGMPVEAFAQTTLRTPLSYLLRPMTDYFRRAFKES